MRLKSRYAAGIAAFATAAMLASGSIVGFKASAQDAAVHPSHIHNGSCAAPGDIVAPLSNTGGTYEVNGTPIAGVTTVGATTAIPVAIGQTVISFALSDLVAAPHALVVHESAANIQNYIACGDLGGAQLDAANLSIGLGPLNNSGYHGVAWLHDNGNGTTLVTVFLLSPDQACNCRDDPVSRSDCGGSIAGGREPRGRFAGGKPGQRQCCLDRGLLLCAGFTRGYGRDHRDVDK